jgi:hypothetical protein
LVEANVKLQAKADIFKILLHDDSKGLVLIIHMPHKNHEGMKHTQLLRIS